MYIIPEGPEQKETQRILDGLNKSHKPSRATTYYGTHLQKNYYIKVTKVTKVTKVKVPGDQGDQGWYDKLYDILQENPEAELEMGKRGQPGYPEIRFDNDDISQIQTKDYLPTNR